MGSDRLYDTMMIVRLYQDTLSTMEMQHNKNAFKRPRGVCASGSHLFFLVAMQLQVQRNIRDLGFTLSTETVRFVPHVPASTVQIGIHAFRRDIKHVF